MSVMTHEEYMTRGRVDRGNITVERLDPRLLTGDPAYLFNIYGNEWTRNTGTTGIYYIPACPDNKPYVRAPQAIPGTVEDIYPHFGDSETYRNRPTAGEDIVAAVLNGGGPNDEIASWGVFASKNEKPTKQELDAAKAKLIQRLNIQLRQADQLFASPDPMDRKSVDDDKFYRAARYLNVKKPWMSEAQEMTVCPFCSSPVRPEAPKCGSCHEIINMQAYEALKASIQGAK